jgi:hypothetical protein
VVKPNRNPQKESSSVTHSWSFKKTFQHPLKTLILESIPIFTGKIQRKKENP